MAESLFGQLKVESVNRDDIRDIVAGRITKLRTKFRTIPLQLSSFHLRLADQLRKRWTQEEKEYKQEKKREKPLERLIQRETNHWIWTLTRPHLLYRHRFSLISLLLSSIQGSYEDNGNKNTNYNCEFFHLSPLLFKVLIVKTKPQIHPVRYLL